jgi:hypothetical protein
VKSIAIVPKYRKLTPSRWRQLNDREAVLAALKDELVRRGLHEAAIVVIDLEGKLWDCKMRLLLKPVEEGRR